MKDDNELLWNVYREHCDWERHHETQRSSVTNIMIAVAAGVIGVISLDGALGVPDLPLSIFLIVQGLFGAVFVGKQYERFARHQRLAGLYREQLNKNLQGAQIVMIRDTGDETQKSCYPLFSRLRLNHLWIYLHMSFAVFGIVLAFIILVQQN